MEGASVSTGQTPWATWDRTTDQNVHMEGSMAPDTYATDECIVSLTGSRGTWA